MPNSINALRTRVVKCAHDMRGRHSGRYQAQGSNDGMTWFVLGECSEPEWAINLAATAYVRATDSQPLPGEVVWDDSKAYEELARPGEVP